MINNETRAAVSKDNTGVGERLKNSQLLRSCIYVIVHQIQYFIKYLFKADILNLLSIYVVEVELEIMSIT